MIRYGRPPVADDEEADDALPLATAAMGSVMQLIEHTKPRRAPKKHPIGFFKGGQPFTSKGI